MTPAEHRAPATMKPIIQETLAATSIALLAEGVVVLMFIACAFVWLGVLTGRI